MRRLGIARAHRIGPGEDVLHAGMRERRRDVHRDDLRVRPVRAHEISIKLPRRIPVGGVFSGAGDETEILDPVAGMMMRSVRVHFFFFF